MKKLHWLLKLLIYTVVLALLFVVTVWGTKYYFYDSDFAVKKTDLSAVTVNGVKIGMNIKEVDLSKYEQSIESVEDCNYNYEGISFKTDDEGKIVYIVAQYKNINFFVGQEENASKIKKVTEVWSILGQNHKEEIYKPEENNYRKISRYLDTENDIYMGLVFSRYNNELLSIILSAEKLK